MARVITIESKVKDMIQATRLAQTTATRDSHHGYLDGRVSAFEQVLGEIAEITEEYIPGYCEGCVRIEMSKMDYGQVFESFRTVASDHCDSCTEDESFAECPNSCASWEITPGVYCPCECHG